MKDLLVFAVWMIGSSIILTITVLIPLSAFALCIKLKEKWHID